MSQDKFWEQWGKGSGEQPAEPKAPGSADSSPVDDDVLAAWLKSLPPNDPLVPPPTQLPAAAPSNPAELAAAWPPQAPVDPFAGMNQGGGGLDSEWDLAFDPIPGAGAPPASTPAAPPSVASPGPAPTVSAYAPPAPSPAADPGVPAPPPAPWAAGPAAAPVTAASPTPAPPVSPFGPPLPPAPPPAEVLQAPPLKLEITIGRRTFEQEVQGEALIGRPDATRGVNPEIDLRTDDAVSRRHAKIFFRGGDYILTDLNSTNGTRHNRKWLQAAGEVVLKPGDEIEVGELTVIRVLEAPQSNA